MAPIATLHSSVELLPPPDNNNADFVLQFDVMRSQQQLGEEQPQSQQKMRRGTTEFTFSTGDSVATSGFVFGAASSAPPFSLDSAVKGMSPLSTNDSPANSFVEILKNHQGHGELEMPQQLEQKEEGEKRKNAGSPKRERKTESSQQEDSSDSSSTKKVFKCTFPGCGKEFHLKGNLKRHQNIHNGEKKFKCRFCGKDFLRKADMEVHHRVHTGEKPYKCKFADCDKCFARRSDLLSHERTHVSECQKKRKIASPSSDDCNCWSAPQEERSATALPSPAPVSIPANAAAPVARYQLTCTEDHVHSPPACFASFASVDSLDNFLLSQETFDMKRPGLEASSPTDCCTGHVRPATKQCETSPLPTFASAVQISGTPPPTAASTACVRSSSSSSSSSSAASPSTSSSCPMDAELLQAYSKHNSNCGHLSILHGNHRDYVVKNHLVCQDRVKSISGGDNHAAKVAQCTEHEPHRPGCGHLPVRHKDHIDYVVEDTLFCQHAGLLEGADNIELLDDDFWEFYGAIGSMNTD